MSKQLNAMHTGPRREDWETPPDLFARYHAEFDFNLDAAANAENAKVAAYLSEEQDAMNPAQRWTSRVWLNPPYGKDIGKWIEKAYHESQLVGSTVVCLVPARTDSWWWHDYALKGEIRYLRRRVKFVGAKYNAPFPSAIVIFGPGASRKCNRCVA
jgi:phage N-6-adenine-methyltransferase